MASAVTSSTDRGCLLVADISGYTDYLMGSELDHAENVLADLIETVVAALRPTFDLSKLEGDAAFAYAVTDRIEASMLLDTVDACYFAFRSRLRDVDRATTCQCNACVLIPELDLKVVVHHGSFVRREVAGNEELTGRDVIVVHRLLKNDIPDAFGIRGYAFLTDACIQAMGIDPAALDLPPHRLSYDDVGEIHGVVEDLDHRWRIEQERRRLYVLPDRAAFEVVSPVLPAPAEVTWEYLTAPEKRALWAADRVDQVAGGPRRGAGTVNHCMHGDDVIIERILDWRPFRYYTAGFEWPGIGVWPWTYELEPVDGGTRVHIRGEALRGHRALLAAAYRRFKIEPTFERGLGELERAMAGEMVQV